MSEKLRQHLLKVDMGVPMIRKSIMVSAIEIATREHIWPVLQMKPQRFDGPHGRIFKSFNTGQSFHDAYASLNNPEANMVPFILFSDGNREERMPLTL